MRFIIAHPKIGNQTIGNTALNTAKLLSQGQGLHIITVPHSTWEMGVKISKSTFTMRHRKHDKQFTKEVDLSALREWHTRRFADPVEEAKKIIKERPDWFASRPKEIRFETLKDYLIFRPDSEIKKALESRDAFVNDRATALAIELRKLGYTDKWGYASLNDKVELVNDSFDFQTMFKEQSDDWDEKELERTMRKAIRNQIRSHSKESFRKRREF